MTATPVTLTLDAVKGALGDLGTAEQVRSNRIKVGVKIERVREAILRAQAILACDHVVQIAAVDNGKTLELLYHLTGPHRMVVVLAIDVPRDNPEVPPTADRLPPAGSYGRQIQDLLGIVFVGHPGLKRIILNEDWPEGEYPLRKDWKPDPSHFYGGVREEAK